MVMRLQRYEICQRFSVRGGCFKKICERRQQIIHEQVWLLRFLVPPISLLRIFYIETCAYGCLGQFPDAVGITEVIIELGPIFVRGRLVAPLNTGILNLLGISDKLEGDGDDTLVRHVIFSGLGIGTAVFYLHFHLEKR